MTDQLADIAAKYVPQLIGRNAAHAFFGLLEADHAILPLLIEAYRAEHNPDLRAALVEVIWQHRQPSTLDFLAEAVRDDHPRIWKEALNGLVTLGANEIPSLDQARLRSMDESNERLEWIEEALEQLYD